MGVLSFVLNCLAFARDRTGRRSPADPGANAGDYWADVPTVTSISPFTVVPAMSARMRK